jgi:hypothetical protein
MGGGWSTPRPCRFTPGKETRYPLYRRLGRPQGLSGLVLKISPPPRFDPRTVQLEASLYTDYAIPAHYKIMLVYISVQAVPRRTVRANFLLHVFVLHVYWYYCYCLILVNNSVFKYGFCICEIRWILMILTEGFAIDLGSCLRWGKPAILCF